MRGTSRAIVNADHFNVMFPTLLNMRRVLGHAYYAAWYAFDFLVAVARKAFWPFLAGRAKRGSPPNSGFSGAGVLAPLLPQPPILSASLARQLPQSAGDET